MKRSTYWLAGLMFVVSTFGVVIVSNAKRNSQKFNSNVLQQANSSANNTNELPPSIKVFEPKLTQPLQPSLSVPTPLPTRSQRIDLNTQSSINLASVEPQSAINNQKIVLRGSNFGSSIGKVWFYNAEGGNVGGPRIDSWSDTEIHTGVYFVRGSRTFYLEVETAEGVRSNKILLNVTAGQPYVASVEPTTFVRGNQVIIRGTEFGASAGNVNFYNASDHAWDVFIASGTIRSWSDGEIIFNVPQSLETKEYGVQIQTSDGRTSSYKFFKVED